MPTRLVLPCLALVLAAASGPGGAAAVSDAPPKPAVADEAAHGAVAAVVVAALSQQFGGLGISVQLQDAYVEPTDGEDRVVSGEGQLRVGDDGEDWLPFRYRALYDPRFASAGYPEVTFGLGDADGERVVPNDSRLLGELDARVAAQLGPESDGQPVRLQFDRITSIEAGGRFLRIDAVGIADFGTGGSTAARVDALYDQRDETWLRIRHELGSGATPADDPPLAGY